MIASGATNRTPLRGLDWGMRTKPARAIDLLCMAQTPYRTGRAVSVETQRLRIALKGRPPDPWLGFDKAQHAAFSFLWTLGSQYTLVNKVDVSERRALPFSVGSGAVLGLAKEVYDRRWGRHRYFSYRDLVADAVGLALAAGLIAL